jgi:hypothetical protein
VEQWGQPNAAGWFMKCAHGEVAPTLFLTTPLLLKVLMRDELVHYYTKEKEISLPSLKRVIKRQSSRMQTCYLFAF